MTNLEKRFRRWNRDKTRYNKEYRKYQFTQSIAHQGAYRQWLEDDLGANIDMLLSRDKDIIEKFRVWHHAYENQLARVIQRPGRVLVARSVVKERRSAAKRIGALGRRVVKRSKKLKDNAQKAISRRARGMIARSRQRERQAETQAPLVHPELSAHLYGEDVLVPAERVPPEISRLPGGTIDQRRRDRQRARARERGQGSQKAKPYFSDGPCKKDVIPAGVPPGGLEIFKMRIGESRGMKHSFVHVQAFHDTTFKDIKEMIRNCYCMGRKPPRWVERIRDVPNCRISIFVAGKRMTDLDALRRFKKNLNSMDLVVQNDPNLEG